MANPLRIGVADALLALVGGAATAAIGGVFFWIVADLVLSGWGSLSWSFLSEAPEGAGRAGGIAPILVSTVLLLLVALAAAVPLGLATAVLLAEFVGRSSRWGRWIRISLDVLAGVPSIVMGLFGMAFFCIYLGLGSSILAGGLTLACMVLPIFMRTAEAALRALPDDWRQAAAALGLSRRAALQHVILPAALPALAAALMLGVGRALAESAALIFTSGYVDRMPGSLLDSGRSLALHIYDLSMNVAGGDRNARASALVLLLLLASIHVAASWFGQAMARRRLR